MIYDVAIIGGGPGGYSAAFRGAELGLSVILFEKDMLGGTCLNRGCVPTKYLLNVSEYFKMIADCGRYGFSSVSYRFDLRKSQYEKNNIISDLRDGLYERLMESGVEIVNKYAEIYEDSQINCDGEIYYFRNAIIATGSNVKKELVNDSGLSSDNVLCIEKIPESVSIIGGGVAAMEFANIFYNFGSKVSLYTRSNRILRKWDKDISRGLSALFKNRGIKIVTNVSKEGFSAINDELIISVTGRKKETRAIKNGLLKVGDDGGILVDRYFRTSMRNVFAVGDVIEGSSMLAHVAMKQGQRAIEAIVGKENIDDYSVISCIYTKPEIASVGMTEEEATEIGLKHVVGKRMMYSNARSIIASKDRGFIKLIANSDDGTIIGAHFMCERATDMISEMAMAIDNGLTATGLLRTIRPHPSFCEEIGEALSIIVSKI